MFFMRTRKKHADSSSEFSVFIREAKSREKKKVYKRIIEKAIEEQNEVVERATGNG